MKTGILTEEQFEKIKYPHSRFKIVGDNNEAIYLPRTYDSPATAIYELTLANGLAIIHKTFTVDKGTREWTYEEFKNTSIVEPDNETTKLNDEELLTIDIDKMYNKLLGTIATNNKGFIKYQDCKDETDKLVPETRTVNGYELKNDITLTCDDVGIVPKTRKINGKALSSDITIKTSDYSSEYVPKTRKVNGRALSNKNTVVPLSDWGRIYRHDVTLRHVGGWGYIVWLTVYNSSSTAFTLSTLETFIKNLGCTNDRTLFPCSGHNANASGTHTFSFYGCYHNGTDLSFFDTNTPGWWTRSALALMLDTDKVTTVL